MSDDDLARMLPATLTDEARAIFYAELERRGHSEKSFVVLQEEAARKEQAVKQHIRERNLTQVKVVSVLVLLTVLTLTALTIAADSLEIVVEIIRLTPMVFMSIGIAFIVYFLSEVLWSIVKWLGRKGRKSIDIPKKSHVVYIKIATIFILAACFEIIGTRGTMYLIENEAMYIGEYQEQVMARLFRQLLYTGILFIASCIVVYSKHRKP